jgi:LAS seventeen-binding protein 1/2
LAETGAISDEQFDTIMNALPSESPLSGASRTSQASPAAPPTAALNNMNLGNPSSPPAYSNSAPSLPDRNTPSKPELIRATALYRYSEPGDCNFEVGDEIVVYEYMNPDWWLGKNLRTGQEGVFPVNYVQAQPQANPTLPSRPGPSFPAQSPYHGNEKGNEYGGGYPQQQPYQAAPQGGPSNPYNSPVPPMQMADQPVENKPGRGSEMGKKFGKKLGNAAIFGAGATMGGDLVNKIF